MRSLGALIGLVIVCIAILFGLQYWPSEETPLVMTSPEAQFEAQIQAEGLLRASKPKEAITIIRQYENEIENFTDSGKKWLSLFIEASAQLKDIPQLVILYEYFPNAFQNHEKPALMVADSYIANEKTGKYQPLRLLWEGREGMLSEWTLLDTDKFLLEGRRDQAIRLLKEKSFEGDAETGRLVRLALLTSKETPKEAWGYLTEAYKKSPNDPDIRSYRAQLLEGVGKNDLALAEYLAATQLAPNNTFLKDQLAEFYIREKDYKQALEVWGSTLAPPTNDTIWLKALFWDKVTTPINITWKAFLVPSGRLRPVVEYLLKLSQNTFWDPSQFEMIPNNQQFLKTEQATFWLRLIAALQEGNESQAWNLLQYNPFYEHSWDPQLETALKRIIAYRKSGDLALAPSEASSAEENEAFPLFHQLANSQDEMHKELQALLSSPDVYAAAFLSAGWNEVALELKHAVLVPNDYPDWVAYGFSQALNQNRGVSEALEFATNQKPTPKMSLLIAELLIANGDEDAALKKLQNIINGPEEIAYRAAWLTSLVYIEKGEFDHATKFIESKPQLANDTLGKETIARIAMLRGEIALADQLYTQLEKESSEAKSFLARKAFKDKNWKRARRLTEQLLQEHPTSPLLLNNLKKIHEEEQKAKR